MKKYLFIVLFVGICFGQDIYPYFSDMAKQLEFEKNKIVISEGGRKQQIISGGGSVFNWLSLINDKEPRYLNAPITTNYRYFSFFDISVNNKTINEIEMLKLMNLNDEVKRIISIYKREVEKYEMYMNDYKQSYQDYKNELSVNNGSIKFQISSAMFYLGLALTVDGFINQSSLSTGIGSVAIIYGLIKGDIFSQKNKPEKPEKPKIKEPTIKQQLSIAQTRAMVEAYNRNLYKLIDANKGPSKSSPPISNEMFKGSGSGFAISEEGLIVTNYHVIENALVVKVQNTQIGKNKLHDAKVVISDPKNDLAILQIEDGSFEGFESIPFSIKTKVSDMGTKVYALGYPLINTMGESIKLTDGLISSQVGFQGDITSYQLSVPIQPGNSGGPLFDQQGNLVGVINAMHRGADNATYAIKSNILANLIELLPNPPGLDNSNRLSNLSLTKQAAIIEDFVVLIKVK
ncbi:MAG: hypothetical protein CMG26_03835 [Candidatus Marinimicrobia bacterium]|nr:hypothetical protein [Candidatus Neomarinimicrobiota bacterium]